MNKSIDLYWEKRIEKCKEALEKNNFEAFITKDTSTAKGLILSGILPKLSCKSVSWGDSISMLSTDIIKEIEKKAEIKLIKTFEKGVPREEILERRRQALLVDVFFTGSNALTESGKLVNLDMVGNRVAGLTFGPKHVIVVVGRNKIVKGDEEAVFRIKNYAAPLNAIRHTGFNTPCMKTSYCNDCKSPDRICNTWTVTEKSYPKGRVKVILVNQDLGL
jgi:L-lactate utilization protein LutC